jgi:hypothetical protein
VLVLGKKWSEISKRLDGRTENSVKNRFNSLMKKNQQYWEDKKKTQNNACSDEIIHQ